MKSFKAVQDSETLNGQAKRLVISPGMGGTILLEERGKIL